MGIVLQGFERPLYGSSHILHGHEMGLRAAERASGASDAARGRIGHIKDEATGIAVPVAPEERTVTRPHSLKS